MVGPESDGKPHRGQEGGTGHDRGDGDGEDRPAPIRMVDPKQGAGRTEPAEQVDGDEGVRRGPGSTP